VLTEEATAVGAAMVTGGRRFFATSRRHRLLFGSPDRHRPDAEATKTYADTYRAS